MNLIINGQEKSFEEGLSLQEVLNKLLLEDKVMAAAVNMNIVKQDKWGEYILSDGDKLELLDFVGGG